MRAQMDQHTRPTGQCLRALGTCVGHRFIFIMHAAVLPQALATGETFATIQAHVFLLFGVFAQAMSI